MLNKIFSFLILCGLTKWLPHTNGTNNRAGDSGGAENYGNRKEFLSTSYSISPISRVSIHLNESWLTFLSGSWKSQMKFPNTSIINSDYVAEGPLLEVVYWQTEELQIIPQFCNGSAISFEIFTEMFTLERCSHNGVGDGSVTFCMSLKISQIQQNSAKSNSIVELASYTDRAYFSIFYLKDNVSLSLKIRQENLKNSANQILNGCYEFQFNFLINRIWTRIIDTIISGIFTLLLITFVLQRIIKLSCCSEFKRVNWTILILGVIILGVSIWFMLIICFQLLFFLILPSILSILVFTMYFNVHLL